MPNEPREPWVYNPSYGTAINLNFCEFGFGVTPECHVILCKFRTIEREAPKKPMKSCLAACPREMEYEPEAPGVSPLPARA